MAKNNRPSPSSQRKHTSQASPDVSVTVDAASPSQLRAWLVSPPSSQAASSWRTAPWPLKRAVELEDRSLFRAWCDWGCSPLSTLVSASGLSLLSSLSRSARVRMMQWMLEDKPSSFSSLVWQLRQSSDAHDLRELDWGAIVRSPKLDDNTARRMASEALLGKGALIPIEDLLHRTGGRLSPSDDLRNILLHRQYSFASTTKSYMEYGDDLELSNRLAKIPEDVLIEVNPGELVCAGSLFAAATLARRLASTQPDREVRRARCQDYRAIFDGWNSAPSRTLSTMSDQRAWLDAVDAVMPFVDWRKPDRNRRSPLHAVTLSSWPESLMCEVLDRLIELRPAALAQRDGAGLLPSEVPDLSAAARAWMLSYDRRLRLENRLRHHVPSTKVIRDALRGEDEKKSKFTPRAM